MVFKFEKWFTELKWSEIMSNLILIKFNTLFFEENKFKSKKKIDIGLQLVCISDCRYCWHYISVWFRMVMVE